MEGFPTPSTKIGLSTAYISPMWMSYVDGYFEIVKVTRLVIPVLDSRGQEEVIVLQTTLGKVRKQSKFAKWQCWIRLPKGNRQCQGV